MAERAVILATAGYDHTVRFWQAPTGVCQRTVAFKDSQVNCIETTPDKQWLAVAGNPQIKLFECHTNNAAAVSSFTGHTNNVTSVGFEKDGKWMFSGSEDGSIKIWDIRAPGYQRDYRGKAPITSVALHPNQVELLCTDDRGQLCTWSLTSNRCISEVSPDGPTPLRSLSVASDASAVAAVSNTGACYVWSLLPSQSQSVLDPVCKVVAHNGFILQCKYSPDARYLATTAADHTVKLWAAGEGQYGLERVLVGHTGWVWSCAYSADSAYLVTASSDKTAKLWDTRTGEIILDYRGHTKALTSIALNDS